MLKKVFFVGGALFALWLGGMAWITYKNTDVQLADCRLSADNVYPLPVDGRSDLRAWASGWDNHVDSCMTRAGYTYECVGLEEAVGMDAKYGGTVRLGDFSNAELKEFAIVGGVRLRKDPECWLYQWRM
jgi:hypothetical protein